LTDANITKKKNVLFILLLSFVVCDIVALLALAMAFEEMRRESIKKLDPNRVPDGWEMKWLPDLGTTGYK
jgi:hypothetical protein